MEKYKVRYYLPQRADYRSRVVTVRADSALGAYQAAAKKIRQNVLEVGEFFCVMYVRNEAGEYLPF